MFFNGGAVTDNEEALYILGFLNSAPSREILSLISPTLNYEAGHIASLPVIYKEEKYVTAASLVRQNIGLCRKDNDSFETSWDFKKHPMI